MDDVLIWLAATNHYLYAEVFRENEITGQKLRQLTDVSLSQLNIRDSTHKQSLLLAIQELFTGHSETVSLLSTLPSTLAFLTCFAEVHVYMPILSLFILMSS